tara:strand:+ start:529 stop:756 length:228 start_codon:yes stop_codon:yes gene_type:complete
MRLFCRDRLTVGIKADQRQGIGVCLSQPAGFECLLWQGTQELPLFFRQQAVFGGGLSTQLALQIVPVNLQNLMND